MRSQTHKDIRIKSSPHIGSGSLGPIITKCYRLLLKYLKINYSKGVQATISIMLFPTLQDQLTKDNFIPFFQALQSYGITLRECIHGNGSQVPVQVQPEWFKGTYSEYAETMKNYIRNHEVMIGECIK